MNIVRVSIFAFGKSIKSPSTKYFVNINKPNERMYDVP